LIRGRAHAIRVLKIDPQTSLASALLGKPPFYAVKIYPGDIGASCGLVTNERAQVLRKDGSTVEGLYACGNDMDSIMAGIYPGPGITLGPAMTFGYLAARHAAEQSVWLRNAST
jgi:succinate dehydrogenase/fumarate reductase flavoprotein subunit